MTRIYAGRTGVQILSGARDQAILQNIHTSSSAHPASKSSFLSGSKVARVDSLTTHICLDPSLKISGSLLPLNLSPSMAHIRTTSFTLTTYLCTYLSRSHILSGLIKEPFHTLLTADTHTT